MKALRTCLAKARGPCKASIPMALAVLLLLVGVVALAQSGGGYDLGWWTVEGGGASFSAEGAYTLGGTVGQIDAGTLSEGFYTLQGGFWGGTTAAAQPHVPAATIHLAKTVSSPTAQPGDTLTFHLVLTATGDAASAALTDTLPLGLTYVPGSASGGAMYGDGQVRYAGPVAPGDPVTLTYRATVDAGVQPGSILYNRAVVTGTGYLLERAVAVAIPDDAFDQALILIYANGDNNLSQSMLRLINNAEVGAGNGHAVALMVLDGPGEGDSYLYRLQEDQDASCPSHLNPTCDGRYVAGQNVWAWGEDVANPYSLAEFLKGTIRAYPNAGQVVLSLVGHGGGWSPDVLAGQPSHYGGQPGEDVLGGMLWDDHPGTSLSTPDLGRALRWSHQATGVKVGLLYLDACLMGMSEVAYEVRDSAEYLLASENWTWASFPYDAHLSVLDGVRDVRQIGEAWLHNAAGVLRADEYPFTLSLVDLDQVESLRAAEDGLATALMATLPVTDDIAAAFAQTDCFDSDRDGAIEPQDNYCDLDSFARQLEVQFSGNASAAAVVSAAQAVQTAVAAAVVAEDHEGGIPWPHPDERWTWGDLGGVSKYLPLHEDHWKRRYYTGSHLQSAEDGLWDEFLAAYWDSADPPQAPPCPPEGCDPLPSLPPLAPIAAHAWAGHSTIQVEWTLEEPVGDLDGYRLLRREGSGDFTPVTTTLLSRYIDDDPALVIGTEYCYRVEALDGTDAVVGESNVACTRHGSLSLWIPDRAAPPGAAEVPVEVNLANGDGLCIGALDITIHYDTAVVAAAEGVSPTTYTAGYAFVANTSSPGQVKIAAATTQCQPLYGPGRLFLIGFDVQGSEGQVSPLDFVEGLTGTIIYDDDDLATPVSLELENGSLTVQSAYVRGDVNGDGVVNSADALLALRIASGQVTSTPRQRSACDVNGDSACSAADATLILHYAVYQAWGRSAVAASGQMTRQAARGPQDDPVRLSIGLVGGSVGQETSVPIGIANGPELAGGTISFVYDPDALVATGASLTTLTGDFELVTHVIQPGLLRVSLASHGSIDADGTLLHLRFTVVGGQVAPLGVSDVRLNDDLGRDFETSTLQRRIEIMTLSQVYLPLVARH